MLSGSIEWDQWHGMGWPCVQILIHGRCSGVLKHQGGGGGEGGGGQITDFWEKTHKFI